MPKIPQIAFDSLSKRFGHVVANDSISCEVATGGIHAFLGENGAGKSTLMKLVSGLYQPDSGSILFDGVPIRLQSPSDARRHGIGMVHQHLSLVSSMTVLDNILLGDNRVPFLLNRRLLAAKVAEKAQQLGFEFDLNVRVSRLSVSDRQKVEIFKLLWRDASVLILDEPTSQLAPFEADEILTVIRNLARAGRAVLWVSHNIGEVMRYASRITILNRGKCITTCSSEATRADEVARLMIGNLKISNRPRSRRNQFLPLISVRNVNVADSHSCRSISDLSFDIFPGEILGVAGVAHSGQAEVATLMTGHLRPTSGSLLIDHVVQPWDSLSRRSSCAAYIPADVKRDASVQTLSIAKNLFLRKIFTENAVVCPFLRSSFMERETNERLAMFDVQPRNAKLDCGALSGGNLQRLVLARELGHDSSLFVAVNPTAGLDVATARMAREKLRSHGDCGKAILLISNDLEELLTVADRLLVLFDGKLIGIESTDTLSAESIGLLMGGVKPDIVRAVCNPANTNTNHTDQARAALWELLQSNSRPQRGLAAQLGWRIFVVEDVPRIREYLATETYAEVRLWLRIALAKLVGGPEIDALARAFAGNPSGFAEAQRKISSVPDYNTLKELLLEQLNRQNASWERTLATLTLEHLGNGANLEPHFDALPPITALSLE